jgi:predicted Zn-dependent protease
VEAHDAEHARVPEGRGHAQGRRRIDPTAEPTIRHRRRLVVGLLATLLGVARTAVPAPPDEKPVVDWDQKAGRIEQPRPHPLAVAEVYASGRRAEAIAMLEGWSEADMKAELVAIRSQMRKMGGRLPERTLQAAVMLHTDREAHERLQSPVVETVRECGINAHGGYARALIGLLMVQSDAARDFVRRWLTAMALSSHWDLCLDDVRRWTREGLKWFPRNATLLLVQATASETSAALTPVPVMFSNPNNRTEGLSDLARRRQELTDAKADLEAALAADPEMQEAGLRLGRVLWRLEKRPEARAALQGVLDRAKDPSILYLGHLFLGRVLEDSGDLSAAIEQYRAALALDPRAQSAAVALSEALLLGGDDDESRQVLGAALGAAPRGEPRDAFMTYHVGRSYLAEGMLDRLRNETLP